MISKSPVEAQPRSSIGVHLGDEHPPRTFNPTNPNPNLTNLTPNFKNLNPNQCTQTNLNLTMKNPNPEEDESSSYSLSQN